MPDGVLRLLHQVDQRCAGRIAMPEVVTADGSAQDHYLVNSLMEEAIRSSQPRDRIFTINLHAGAHAVTHETARKDLRTLEQRGLLARQGTGRRLYFSAPGDLEKRLDQQNPRE